LRSEFNATLGEIAAWTGGSIISGDAGKEIKTIITDSRDTGAKSLFVPLIGEKFDGHDFIRPLAESGKITAYLTMKKNALTAEGVSAILCDDTLKAYGRIAANHRKRMNAAVIGITGTNGKTTAKEMIHSILNRKGAALKNEKNYNNEIGVPYTLLGLKEEHKWAVIEMGMNHKGEIDTLSRIAEPDIALITNAGEGHLEFLGSVENVAYAKAEIMRGMKPGSLIVLNSDTSCFGILKESAVKAGLKVRTFGIYKDADVRPSAYKMFKDSIRIDMDGEAFEAPAYGLHNIYNALAAVAVTGALGIGNGIIKEALKDFKCMDMRSQVIEGRYTVINDTYNSNPLSARYALNSLAEIFPDKRRIAVLSDMRELGESAKYYHSEIGKLAYSSGVDMLLTWGSLAEYINSAAKRSGMREKKALHFIDKNELIDFVEKNVNNNDVILVKGSRSMKMEEVVEALIH